MSALTSKLLPSQGAARLEFLRNVVRRSGKTIRTLVWSRRCSSRPPRDGLGQELGSVLPCLAGGVSHVLVRSRIAVESVPGSCEDHRAQGHQTPFAAAVGSRRISGSARDSVVACQRGVGLLSACRGRWRTQRDRVRWYCWRAEFGCRLWGCGSAQPVGPGSPC